MKKGFTLMEMIAVIGIIALMTIMVLPAIINQVGNKKEEISSTTKTLIYTATDLYLNNNISEYPKTVGITYCIKLEKLTSQGYLKTPLTDASTGKELNLNRMVKVFVNSYKEYEYDTTGYGLLNEGETCE